LPLFFFERERYRQREKKDRRRKIFLRERKEEQFGNKTLRERKRDGRIQGKKEGRGGRKGMSRWCVCVGKNVTVCLSLCDILSLPLFL